MFKNKLQIVKSKHSKFWEVRQIVPDTKEVLTVESWHSTYLEALDWSARFCFWHEMAAFNTALYISYKHKFANQGEWIQWMKSKMDSWEYLPK